MPGNNFREGLTNGARAATCKFFEDAANAANWFYDKTRPLWLPRRDQLPNDGKVWGGVQGLLCGDVPDNPVAPTPDPGFRGGQCETLYRVDGQGSYFSSFRDRRETNEFTSVDLIGPISSPNVVQDGNIVRWFIDGTDQNTGERTTRQLASVTSSIGTVSDGAFENIDIERLDGQPDECGNPPGAPGNEFPPPAPGSTTINIDIDYNNNNGTQITIPTVFVFAKPTVNIDGRLTIPIDMRGANFNLTGNLDVNTGDINFNFDGGAPGNEACCQPPELPEPPPEEVEPPDEPEEEESVIIGVVVTATTVSTTMGATRVFQDGAPTIYHPRLGNVYFRIKIGESTVWTQDIPVRVRQEYVPCPADFGAVAVIGVPSPGVEWTLSPIRRRIIESEFPD